MRIDLEKLRNQKKASMAEPRVVSSDPAHSRREELKKVMPKGSSLSPKTANWWGGTSTMGTGGSSVYHTQRPYMPEFDSPDRQWYPDDPIEARKYWRLFLKTDPIFGTAIDLYSTMLTSEHEVTLTNANDSSIKTQLNEMCESVNLQEVFQNIVKEYLGVGEAAPHTFFDGAKGLWDHVGFHDPDNLEVIDSPMINMAPMISFLPPEDLREMLSHSSPEAAELRQKLPANFVSKVLSNQKIRLSPLNCSFIPRKLHPYDDRGTSLASRLWRINMVEDAVYNSTIATYRRSAAPLKVVKLGSEATGWIPGPEQEKKMLEMLTQAELDPQSYLVYNYGVNFETWGNNERATTIKNENAVIETIKLNALGLSKSFMSGDVAFSAAKSGLQVLLRRLLSLRQFIESAWLYPKFFKPIVEINDWKMSTKAEVDHRIKIKRTAQEADERNLLIKPKIRWKNRLDSAVDEDLLRALLQLKNLNFNVSQDTIGQTCGLDWRDEQKKTATEFKEKEQILDETLGATQKQKFENENGAKPAGGAGSGSKPGGAGGKGAPKQKDPSTPPGNSESNGVSDESVDAPGDMSID